MKQVVLPTYQLTVDHRPTPFTDETNEDGLYSDSPFNPDELVSVNFGEACAVEDREEITALLKGRYPHAKTFEVIRNNVTAKFAFKAC